MLEKFRERAVAQRIIEKIKEEVKGMEEVRFMHVCGTHEDTVTRRE